METVWILNEYETILSYLLLGMFFTFGVFLASNRGDSSLDDDECLILSVFGILFWPLGVVLLCIYRIGRVLLRAAEWVMRDK